jgi:hypothetical protein
MLHANQIDDGVNAIRARDVERETGYVETFFLEVGSPRDCLVSVKGGQKNSNALLGELPADLEPIPSRRQQPVTSALRLVSLILIPYFDQRRIVVLIIPAFRVLGEKGFHFLL